MLSQIITQEIDDKPSVLVVGEETDLRRLVVRFFKQNGFSVAEKSSFDENTSQQQYYKVLFLDHKRNLLKSELQVLWELQSKLLIITTAETKFSSDEKNFSIWQKQAQKSWERVSEFKKVLPQASLVVGVDLINPQFDHPFFSLFSDEEHESVVLPQIDFFPQTLELFISEIDVFLLSPWSSQKKLFCGKMTSTQDFIQVLKKDFPTFVESISFKEVASQAQLEDYPISHKKTSHHPVSIDFLNSFVKGKLRAFVEKSRLQAAEEDSTIPKPKRTPSFETIDTAASENTTRNFPRRVDQLVNTKFNNTSLSESSPLLAKDDSSANEKSSSQANVSPKFSSLRDERKKDKDKNANNVPYLQGINSQTKEVPNNALEKESKTTQPEFSEKSKVKNNQSSNTNDEKEIELTKAVQRIFNKQQVTHKVDRTTKLAKETKKISKKANRRQRAFFGGVVLSGVVLGLLVLVVVFVGTYWRLQQQFKKVIYQAQSEISENEINRLTSLTTFLDVQTTAYASLLGEEILQRPLLLSQSSQQAVSSIEKSQTTQDFIERGVTSFLGSNSEDALSLFKQASTNATETYQTMSLLQTSLEEIIATQDEKQQLKDILEKVKQDRKSLILLQQIEPLLPQLLGIDQKKTYAILLQDNQELRPSGGFLYGVLLLTVDKGLLVDSQLLSTYQLDEKFSGEMIPPVEIEKYLGEKNLYLRDANWDPNFPKSAETIALYLEKTTHRQIDAVFALNLYVLQDIIRAVGPIDVPEYNEVVTDRNIFERAEFHSEIKLVEETDVPDYLTLIARKIVDKVLLMDEDKVGGVLAAISQNLNQNQILLNFLSEDLDQSFSILGWGGEILSPSCPVQFSQNNCVVDSFFVVETNVGVNKANYSIRRFFEHEVDLKESEIFHTRKITLSNTSGSNAWPQGTYKVFIRAYVPTSSSLQSVSIDEKKLPVSQVTQKVVSGKKEIGFLVEVPIQSQKTITIQYSRKEDLQAPFSYAFFEQKQAGVNDTPFKLNIIHDPILRPITIAPQAEVSGNKIIFSFTQNTHQFVGAEFNE